MLILFSFILVNDHTKDYRCINANYTRLIDEYCVKNEVINHILLVRDNRNFLYCFSVSVILINGIFICLIRNHRAFEH